MLFPRGLEIIEFWENMDILLDFSSLGMIDKRGGEKKEKKMIF